MELDLALIKWENEKNLANALAVFELNENSSEKDLQAAYHKLLLKYHPDGHQTTKDSKDLTNCISKIINTAHDFIETQLF